MRVPTAGRRSGQERTVVIGYYPDGVALVSMAMNGWADPEPAWWLNLQARPECEVDIGDGQHRIVARAAAGDERERLWEQWRQIDRELDQFAAVRSRETAVVVFEPVP